MSLAAVQQMNVDTQVKVLIVEDDPDLREALYDTLELANIGVVAADSGEQALKVLAGRNDIGMIVSDVNMGGMSGHELLAAVKKDYPHLSVMLITAYASIAASVDAMRNGAVDYLVKPFAPAVLVDAVNKYMGNTPPVNDDEPVAVSAASRQLLALAERLAQSDTTAMILGESGTGKEVLARYIHNHSPRAKQPFVAINCAAIPENMLEAMLFGHEKGAYTGAYNSMPGKFEQANGGTLLLDEISEMDLGLQAKLLRVLQEREVERIGGRKVIELDVRVIATSNRDMKQQVAAGKFREDLYYRLNVLPLRWTALRERPDDILPLAQRLMAKHVKKQGRNNIVFSPGAIQALHGYSWPGNVRELDNVMQRALILQSGNEIQAEDLALDTLNAEFNQSLSLAGDSNSTKSLPVNVGGNNAEAPSTIPGSINAKVFSFGVDADSGLDNTNSAVLGDDLKQREFEIIVQTLNDERGSRKATAEKLGISARTLRYKIARLRELGLDVDRV